MSIQAVSAYRVGDQVFPTIQEAQRKELQIVLADGGVLNESAEALLDSILKHTDDVVAILTCAPKSKKPRSDKGTHRKKTPYVAVNAALQDAKQ